MRTLSLGDSPSDRSEEVGGGHYTCDFGEEGIYAFKAHFAEGCCSSQGADVSVHDVSAFLG